MLVSLGAVEGAGVADLFAGSGALGIEALSRGAASAVFVERDDAALRCIRANLEATGVGPSRVVRADAVAWAEGAGPVDVVLCDPPYAFADWDRLLTAVPAPLVVAESDRPVDPPAGWEVLRSRRYGTTVVEVLRRTPAP